MKTISIIFTCLVLPLGFVFAKDAKVEIPVPDFKDAGDEIFNATLSKEVQQNYPYYMSGFDDEDVPVWVSELGKWDSRAAVDGSPEMLRDYKINLLQMFKRCIDSTKIRNTEDNPVDEFVLVFDMEGFDVRQTSPETLKVFLWIARQAEQAFTKNLKAAYMVNANYFFTTTFDLMKPLLGRSVFRVEVFGTNKDVWVPKLLQSIPKDQLPKFYGGSPNHKPVKLYG